MTSERHAPALAPEPQLRRALAHQAYRDNRVRIVERDLTGATCLVASRQGLFAVSPDGARQVAHGLFFGLRRYGDLLYAFESCDRQRGPSRMGRVVRIRIASQRLCDEAVIATGLDNQCHQLAVFGERIHVVDTAHQAIVRLSLDGSLIDTRFPFGDPAHGPYHHINSIAQIDGQTLVMLHNGAQDPSRPSELAWLDDAWRVTRREPLPGHGCHDIVTDDAGLLWHCGSMAGELLNANGLRVKVSDRLTRGLAFTPQSVIVGTSLYAAREARAEIGGSILFLDRDLKRTAEVRLPGAPTEIAAL